MGVLLEAIARSGITRIRITRIGAVATPLSRTSGVVPVRTAALSALALALVASGCGAAASDNIVVSGSSTVEPITIAVAEAFAETRDDVNVFVDGPGTGDGFELFCDGETDINDASSRIAADQVDDCARAGVEFIELRIGNDGIVMLANEANDDVGCLTMGDIYALVGPESQGIDTWHGAESIASELGSDTDLPQRPLAVTGPGEESGTYVSFVELALEDIAEERGEAAETRPDYQASSDDNIIIQGIQGANGALGWVGYAFASEASQVKLLEVDDGAGCVGPDDTTISELTYPLSRPLYIYVNAQRARESAAVADFVDLYLGDAIGAVEEVGYVAQTPEALEETRQRWRDRSTGVAP